MTPERFAAIVATYGACADRWPRDETAAALLLVAGDASAARLMREEAVMDTLLSRYAVSAPHGAMVGRAMASFRPSPGLSILRRWWVRLTFSGAGLAGVAAGALCLGAMRDRQSMAAIDGPTSIFAAMDLEEEDL